jgi:hypothetical protein
MAMAVNDLTSMVSHTKRFQMSFLCSFHMYEIAFEITLTLKRSRIHVRSGVSI